MLLVIIFEQKSAIIIIIFNMSIIPWNWSIVYNNIICAMSSYWWRFLTKAKKLLSSFIDYFELHTFLAKQLGDI